MKRPYALFELSYFLLVLPSFKSFLLLLRILRQGANTCDGDHGVCVPRNFYTEYDCQCEAGYQCTAACVYPYTSHKCVTTSTPTDTPSASPTMSPTSRPTVAGCTDDIKNGEETDIDCGGPQCQGCPTGGICRLDGDCQNGSCDLSGAVSNRRPMELLPSFTSSFLPSLCPSIPSFPSFQYILTSFHYPLYPSFLPLAVVGSSSPFVFSL